MSGIKDKCKKKGRQTLSGLTLEKLKIISQIWKIYGNTTVSKQEDIVLPCTGLYCDTANTKGHLQ